MDMHNYCMMDDSDITCQVTSSSQFSGVRILNVVYWHSEVAVVLWINETYEPTKMNLVHADADAHQCDFTAVQHVMSKKVYG